MNDLEKIDRQEKNFISRNAQLIEKVLEAFNLVVRIVDIQIEPKAYEYQLEVAVGTNLEVLENHSRDLALALASPTGKVEMIIPIPGRSLVGIRVPRPSKKEILDMKLDELKPVHEPTSLGRSALLASPFYLMASFLAKIGDTISKHSD